MVRSILLGLLCIVATAQTAMARHMPAWRFAFEPAQSCSSWCTISHGHISCPRFLVTPDNYPPGCFSYKMTSTACGWQLERVFRCPEDRSSMTSNIALRAPKQQGASSLEPCWIDLQRLLGVNVGNNHEARERLTQFKNQEELSRRRRFEYAKCWPFDAPWPELAFRGKGE